MRLVSRRGLRAPADETRVDFDRAIDFSTLRTFALRQGTVDSPLPELDNPLFVKHLGDSVRAALVGRKLAERATQPDLLVDYRITGTEIWDVQRGQGMNMRGIRFPSPGPRPVRSTQGTLVIDLSRPGDTIPAWRGVYRDDEGTAAKLVQNLLNDARKLLASYPPRTR